MRSFASFKKVDQLGNGVEPAAASTVQPKDGAAYMLKSPVSAIFADTPVRSPPRIVREMIAHQREETINDRRENIAVFL
jgi:hypothetical protein